LATAACLFADLQARSIWGDPPIPEPTDLLEIPKMKPAIASLKLLFCLSVGSGCLVTPGCSGGASTDDAQAPTTTSSADADPAPTSREGWPTEDEAKDAIFRVEHAIHASQTNKDVWHVKDMRHEVHSVRFADSTTEKQMDYGRQAITVYPAKIQYTRITEYTDKEATREELGADGVWYLYQDSFGDWTGKYARD
jgi:hypothetical protein